MQDWVRNLLMPRVGERVAGAPTSASGASSLFLWWDTSRGEKLTEASVTLEVVRRPEIDRLVTFALQGALQKPSGGSCHIGLQHHPKFEDRGAVVWEGYTSKGEQLDSDTPNLPSKTGDPASRDFPWRPGVPYRLLISRGDQRDNGQFEWGGTVESLESGERHVIRNLLTKSPYMKNPVMYVESFVPCDGPRFEVRWSHPTAVVLGGGVRSVKAMRVDYQPHAAGGCTNTTAYTEGSAFVQSAGQMRTTRTGSTIRID